MAVKAGNVTDQDQMVAAGTGGCQLTLETGQGVGQQWHTAGAGLPGKIGEFVGLPAGKALGQRLLLGREHVEREMTVSGKKRQQSRIETQAPQHQGWLKRHGGEGIDGQPNRRTVSIESRDDGDAGRVLAERSAQIVGDKRQGHERTGLKGRRLSHGPVVYSDAMIRETFAHRLVVWHVEHGRHDLPWSGRLEPYRVWLSEIMLQQTQVTTVIPYFQRFVVRFPHLTALAKAPLNEVLALWSGLGYYARARHLHACAQVIEHEHGGAFPSEPALLARLPGIGRSTANAIAAFCFGARVPILDGNVRRVLCRYAGIEGWPGLPAIERRLWALAESLLPESDAMAAYTQAQMDLGALICTPRQPSCGACPLAGDCIARQSGRVAELPMPRPRRTAPELEQRLLLLLHDGRVWLERRPPAGIWGGLLAPPVVPEEQTAETCAASLGWRLGALYELPPLDHALTHLKLRLQPLLASAEPLSVIADGALVGLTFSAADTAPLPAPIRRLLAGLAAGA